MDSSKLPESTANSITSLALKVPEVQMILEAHKAAIGLEGPCNIKAEFTMELQVSATPVASVQPALPSQ